MISNSITLLRIALIAPLFWLLSLDGYPWIALGLYLLAGLLDVVDGRVARALGEVSPFGAMLDLIGDRLLTLGAVGGLIAGGGLSGAWAALGLLLIARDLVVAGFEVALPRFKLRLTVFAKLKIAMHFLAVSLLILGGEFRVIGERVLAVAVLMAWLQVYLGARQAWAGFKVAR